MPVLSSDTYGLVGNGTSDNVTAINNWIAAANALIAAGNGVRMVLTPGVYASSGFHAFPGAADLEFQNASMTYSGSSDANAFMTHGAIGVSGAGNLYNINLFNTNSSALFNMNFVGLRLLNKNHSYCSIGQINNFHTGVRLEATGYPCSSNTIDIFGQMLVCRQGVEIVSADAATTNYSAQNIIRGGNVQTTDSFANLGSAYGLVMTRYYANGYYGNSGNFWYGPCFQLGNSSPGSAANWLASTDYTSGVRLLGIKSGLEWLVQTGGTSGSPEPTTLPSGAGVIAKTNITITAGSAICTMASTMGLSTGMQLRGDNPLNAFPLNTYIQSVDSSTQITLTQSADASSGFTTITTFTGTFTALVTDGTCKLACLGPYRRAPVWLRDAGTDNGIRDARWEGNIGGAVVISGRYLFPQNATNAGRFQGSFHSQTPTPVNIAMYPKWTASHAYAPGDMVTPAVLGRVYWDCIAAGTSGAAEPTQPDTPLTQFTDNSVTWISRALPTSASRGDFEEFTGSPAVTVAEIQSPTQVSTSTQTVDALHMRAIGSATGWRVKGMVRGSASTGPVSLEFTPSDFTLSREGLFLNSTSDLLGIIVRTDKVKSVRVRKHFGSYGSSYL